MGATEGGSSEAHDAAALWLLDQIQVRAEWARAKGLPKPTAAIKRGRWYWIRTHDAVQKTIGLLSDGGEIAYVNLTYLVFSRDRVESVTVVPGGHFESAAVVHGGDYYGVCPKGHHVDLGGFQPKTPEVTCEECGGYEYPWEHESKRAKAS